MLGGRLICGNDCNDNARHIHPNQSDVCNGIDDNCNGAIDDLPDYLALVFEDTDGDGFGDPGSKMVDCPAPIGSNTGSRPSSLLGNDCDDTNPAIQPGTIVCDASARRKVFVCNSVGVFEPSVCPGGRGMKCVPQPNGTGICQR
jgi:hypothetical protein